MEEVSEIREESSTEGEFDAFEKYRSAIVELVNGKPSAIHRLAAAMGKLPDALVDEINEIAYDILGDLLIEDDGMGTYSVIEDYKEYFN